ncbi:YdeI/OmpD-associated family protein [Spirosoma panaciterrae]|uniref:YdeI/OmpD-associated family protein n=1 Tax=Spirosoma panaciterrae TaxID=496058 RepID=UPI00037E5013|nr:YdeI/OmpD-associated family protein [Spirosoma panaciterrae]
MPTFTTILQKFGEKGDKTRWTYLEIPMAVSDELKPGQKTSFRVKGTLDHYPIKQIALLPLGKTVARITDGLEGGFMMPVNAAMRRGMGKEEEGASVRVTLEVDNDPMPISADLLDCLDDEPVAKAYFQTLSRGHQNYFSNWIEDAKTIETRTKRLTQAITGLAMKMNFGEMIRYFKKNV